MWMTQLVAVILLAADAGPEAPWLQAARVEGITVFSRERPDSKVSELKAVGTIDAPPLAVWAVLRDYENYAKTMPYTETSTVLSREEGGKVVYFHSVVNPPLVDRRDYVIKLVDVSDWKDGKGFLKVTWSLAPSGPPASGGVIRVRSNDGYWLLEPRDRGTKTFATYYLFTDPGGSIPKWVANRANGSAVPDLFKQIRKLVASRTPAK